MLFAEPVVAKPLPKMLISEAGATGLVMLAADTTTGADEVLVNMVTVSLPLFATASPTVPLELKYPTAADSG